MSDKKPAREQIVASVHTHNISLAEISQAPISVSRSDLVSRFFGYLGLILLLIGFCAGVGIYWEHFSSNLLILLTFGAGFAMLLMALAMLAKQRYVNLVTLFFLVSAIFQSMGIVVMLIEYGGGADVRYGILFLAVVMLIQQGALFWSKRCTVLAFTSICFGCLFLVALLDLLAISLVLNSVIIGLSLIVVSYLLANSCHTVLVGFGYFCGGLILFIAIYVEFHDKFYEILYPGVGQS